jgi:hypothetical protein
MIDLGRPLHGSMVGLEFHDWYDSLLFSVDEYLSDTLYGSLCESLDESLGQHLMESLND